MATPSNTNSLVTDLNVDPYYDDFDETKNFHRILYRPGLAVQARELTQTQSILQNQIDRFAEHIFKEGSVVNGMAMNIDRKIKYLRIRDDDKNNNSVNVANFTAQTITGAANGVTAYVIDVADGSEAGTPDTKTLYIRYTSVGTNTGITEFASGELLTANNGYCANVVTGSADYISNNAIRVSFDTGTMFAKDHFIRVDSQAVIASKYNTTANTKVGFNINESIVTSVDDLSLLDPAQGAYNYAAPGADRLKLTANIALESVTGNNAPNFVEVLRLKNGYPEFKADKPQYSVINDYIARRTFDESGNYIVNGLNVRLREHLNSANNQGVYTLSEGGSSQRLVVDVSPGKAYIRGYELELHQTVHIPILKGIDANATESLSVPANYGNYVLVNNVVGVWDINGQDKVSLYDTAHYAIANGVFSGTSPSGSSIGTARVRALELNSGTIGLANTSYRMYLYDIQMSGATPFESVRSVYMNNATDADGFADPVLTSNVASLLETSFNKAVFNVPSDNLLSLRDSDGNYDITWKFMKGFDTSFSLTGTVTLLTGDSNERYEGTGALNETQKNANFVVISNDTEDAADALTGGATIAVAANGQLSGTGSAFTSELLPGDLIKVDTTTYTVASISSDTLGTVIVTPSHSADSGTAYRTFVPGQIINLNGAGRSITINSTTSATLDLGVNLNNILDVRINAILTKVDGPEAKKLINKNRYVRLNLSTHSANTVGPWDLGLSDIFKINSVRYHTSAFTSASQGTDVTSSFSLDTGQRDNFYDHGRLKLKTTATYTPSSSHHLLVDLDYFTHDTVSAGVGYFSVDSYPIDDTSSSNTSAITTSQIPIFTSPVSGDKVNLRNAIDIRPRITDTANNETTVSSATTNPAAGTTIDEPSTSLHYPKPNEDFLFDLRFYLPRKDRIVMTPEGQFRVIKGVPSNNPQTPPLPSDGMTLAIVDVAAYPSLPYENARRIGRFDNVCKINPVRQVRFTMRDIGVLKDRIDNLEYYTSLSLLENDAKNMVISDTLGNERFKNGILVDPFSGHNIGDPFDVDYRIAVDTQKQEIRPMFNIRDIDIDYNSSTSTSVEQNGKYITLPILSHDVILDQPLASNVRNATGLFYNFRGDLELSPDNDFWTDTTVKPDVQVDFDFNTDNWRTIANAFGTQWGDWKEIFRNVSRSQEVIRTSTGVLTDTTETTTVGQSRDGTKITVIPQTMQQSIGETVRNVNILPFMRSKIVNFTARGLKPRARVYAFFDGEDVGDYCRLTNISFENPGSFGGELIVDTNGELYGQFRIPNNDQVRFRVGTLTFLLTDNPFGRIGSGEATTYASDQYSASGLSQEVRNTIVSTRAPKVNIETVNESTTSSRTDRTSVFTPNPPVVPPVATPTISPTVTPIAFSDPAPEDNDGDGGGDPIAQTFTIRLINEASNPAKLSSGVFATKLDLYFAGKDSAQPVKIELREVDPSTGYVTNRVVPFSSIIVPASSVNVSADSSTATTITWTTPIYLLTNTPYAVIIKPIANNPNYTLWTARLGDNDLLTGSRISSQPAAGIFFASSNDQTWSPIQEEDLKYTLYIANFGTSKSGIASFRNKPMEYLTIDAETGPLNSVGANVVGESTLTVASPYSSPAAAVGDTIVGAFSVANGTVTSTTTVGTTQRITLKLVNGTFSVGEQCTLYQSGVATSAQRQLTAISTPRGVIDFYDNVTQDDGTKLRLSAPSGTFLANSTIVDTETGFSANIVSVDTIPIDTIHTMVSRLDLQDTSVVVGGKFARTTVGSLDSEFFNLEDDEDTNLASRKYVLGNAAETTLGSKTGNINIGLANGLNYRHSPVIDTDKTAFLAIENLVNNDATGEANTAGGNALARYITRTVTLAEGQDAEDLKVYITAYKPSTATINVYYKILHKEDGDLMTDRSWREMSLTTLNSLTSDEANKDDYKEYEYTIPAADLTGEAQEANTVVQYTNSNSTLYSGYKYYKIKIVLLSSTTSNVPRVKDLRAIAVQA